MSLNRGTGIWCKSCEDMGDMYSELIKDTGGVTGQGMRVKCNRNHSYPYSAISGFRKKALPLIEKRPEGTVEQPIWAYPEALQAIHNRYPQNFQTTLCSMITALADGDTIILEGEHVREMRELQAAAGNSSHPLERGRDVLGLARENSSLWSAVNELQEKLKHAESGSRNVGTGGMAPGVMNLVMEMAAKLGIEVPAAPQPGQQQSVAASATSSSAPRNVWQEASDRELAAANSQSAVADPRFAADPFENPAGVNIATAHGPDELRGIPKPQPGNVR